MTSHQPALRATLSLLEPILDPTCRREIEASLELALTDTALAWSLDADGEWSQVASADGAEPFDSQEALMLRARST